MKLFLFTLALDCRPFLEMQLANFNRLKCDWRWSIAHGAALNAHCTSWCSRLQPRLSRDGTTEMLHSLHPHPRITVHHKQSWNGKVEQVNTCLADFKEPGIVVQVDADEVFLPHQLEGILDLFAARPDIKCARFFCRYYVGRNLIITSTHSYGNRPSEWLRAWRWPGSGRALKHEPPVMEELEGPCATREETRDRGLVFEHFSWYTEQQCSFKGAYYQYPGAVSHWRRLQAHTKFPCELRSFLPWVDKGVIVDKLFR